MSKDFEEPSRKNRSSNHSSANARQVSRTWLRTPGPIKRVFDKFPLQTYPANELPERCAGSRNEHALYIFTTAGESSNSKPSFNPGCLKWQAYLRFQGLKFVTVPSSNHASPSGALPFLIPAVSDSESPAPVPSHRIQRWADEIAGPKTSSTRRKRPKSQAEQEPTPEESNDPKENDEEMPYEAYTSLLDYRIRNAYLYTLYLSPSNFASVASPLYIQPTTKSTIVRSALGYQLQTAAQGELIKHSPLIDAEALYRESEKAFSALAELLGEEEYFFGEETPGLFDASVFAYTNVLLDEGLQWKETRMVEGVRRFGNLVGHRERILRGHFGDDS